MQELIDFLEEMLAFPEEYNLTENNANATVELYEYMLSQKNNS